MKTLRNLSLVCFFAALSWLAWTTAQFVKTAERVTAELPDKVLAEVADTRADLLAEVATTRADLLAEVQHLEKTTARELRATRELATETRTEILTRVDAALVIVDETRSNADKRLAVLEGVAAEAEALISQTNATVARVDKALVPFVDCKNYPDCFFNRYVGVAQSTENAAEQIAESLPELTAASKQIAVNVEKTTANLEKLTRPAPLAIRAFQAVGPIIGGALYGWFSDDGK